MITGSDFKMQKIDNEQFGKFLVSLRKQKNLTQKQLAEKLYISDKAVSKWERGASLPDISMLMPLAKILGVTTTELLSGKRIDASERMTVDEVEGLMTKTIVFSNDKTQNSSTKRLRIVIFAVCALVVALEIMILLLLGYTFDAIRDNLGTVELLMMIFGAYFAFFAKETLPLYYDENKISFYNDGVFRMNIPGVTINNSNWRHILKAVYTSIMCICVLFPLLYLSVSYFAPAIWQQFRLYFTLASVFAMFIPMYAAGKKYE